MAAHLLIVTGWPGAGKSWIARAILKRWPHLRVLSYDALKEAWWDREGFDGQAQKDALNARCLQAFWQQLDAAMATGEDLMIEYPFCAKHVPSLKRLLDAHGYQPLTVVLDGEPEVLWQRYSRRDSGGKRHPGHACTTYFRDGRQVRAPGLSLEQYTRECREKNYHIDLGPTLTLDRTRFRQEDDDRLLAFLERYL